MSDLEAKKFLILLSHFPKFGPQRLKKIKNHFSCWQEAYQANRQELAAAGINPAIADEFCDFRQSQDWPRLKEKIQNEQIDILELEDGLYPPLLKEIFDPPGAIYYKGDIDLRSAFPVAIVGTRKISRYGRRVAEELSFKLGQAGFSIISGLALGVDALAHLGAVRAGAKTVAVLGTGIDQASIYPRSNRYLAQKITAEGGGLVSEFPLLTPPLRHNFPQRNRIISGLSLGTIVVEAGERSGALITAYQSLEQNREVFAVPGDIYSPSSKGPNRLIREGARLIESAEDVIEALNLPDPKTMSEAKKTLPETAEEKAIIECLDHEPVHIDALPGLTNLTSSVINSKLVLMEMKGMVKNIGGMRYIKL